VELVTFLVLLSYVVPYVLLKFSVGTVTEEISYAFFDPIFVCLCP